MKVEHRDKGRCPLKGHIAAEAAMNDIVRNYHCAPKIWISGRLISRSDLRKCLVQCGVGGIVGHLRRVAHWPQRVWTLWSSNPRPEAKLWNVIVFTKKNHPNYPNTRPDYCLSIRHWLTDIYSTWLTCSCQVRMSTLYKLVLSFWCWCWCLCLC